MTKNNLNTILRNAGLSLEDIKPYIKLNGLVYEDNQEKYPENVTLHKRDDLSLFYNKDLPDNTLIEGDNLESLTYLKDSGAVVDVIYIDPPYNTGNKDFVYDDDFNKQKDTWRHSNWLSFMEKRLLLAKDLLSDEGVIFISIDDNEQAHLRLLCDAIFGEEHFLGTLIQNKGNAQNDAHSLQSNHEYIHVYKKKNVRLYTPKKVYKQVFKDSVGFYYLGNPIVTGGARGTLKKSPTLGYTIYYHPETKDVIPYQDVNKEQALISNDIHTVYTDNQELISKGYVPIRPPKKGKVLGAWTWGLEHAIDEKDTLHIYKRKDVYNILPKKYVDSDKVTKNGKLYYFKDISWVNSRSILDFPTAQGTSSLTDIFDYKIFNNAKNVGLIKYLIQMHPNKNATVLDFFAGSGTTGQAVLELNKEDNGKRKFILCTINEVSNALDAKYLADKGLIDKEPTVKRGKAYIKWKESIAAYQLKEEYKMILQQEDYKKLGLCRSVTYERISAILKGYTNNKGVEIEGIAANLNYYEVKNKSL